MDVSSLFKACVTTANLYVKSFNEDTDININSKVQRKRTAFNVKIQILTNQLSKLYELLLENRQAYANFFNYSINKSSMTDIQRDEIDRAAQNIINRCLILIKELKGEIAMLDILPQNQEHCEIVAFLIEEYLKRVCKEYSKSKALRVKKAMELRKMSKLALKKENFKNNRNLNTVNNTEIYTNNNDSLEIQELNGDISNILYSEDEQVSSEDFQMFETENEELYTNLNTLTEEVKQIETKVVHIAELQEIFTEKVLNQDMNLDHILTTVVGSTENVKEANEQIRQAIQRNASLRVWILFFLLVMSFSLLFLDWFNP